MRKSLVIGLLLAVMALATIGGAALAQDPTAPPQQQGWCHGSDGVCPYGVKAEQRANGVCPHGITSYGCHGTITPPAAQ